MSTHTATSALAPHRMLQPPWRKNALRYRLADAFALRQSQKARCPSLNRQPANTPIMAPAKRRIPTR